jgi:copper chaperone CopZ
MDKVVLDLPALWADHHVLRVREALMGLAGVEDVYASAAWKQVLVTYDSKETDQEAIEKTLTEAGYPVGAGAPPVLAVPGVANRDPKWATLGFRMTETNRADREMSGEFRRY